MRKIVFVLFSIILFAFSGCCVRVTGDEKLTEEYVKSQGYDITVRKGEVQKYTLEKIKLYGATFLRLSKSLYSSNSSDWLDFYLVSQE